MCTPAFQFKLNTFFGFGFISGYGVLPKLYFFNFKFTRQGHLLCTPAFQFKLNTFLIKSFLAAKFGFIGGYGVLPKLYFPNIKITRQQRFLSFQQEPFLDLDVLFGKLKDIKPRQQSVEW